VVFNPTNPNIIASASSDMKTIISDLRQSQVVRTFQSDTSYVNIHWKSDGSQLVIATKDDRLELYETAQWKPLEHNIDSSIGVNEVKWDRFGKWLVVTCVSGQVRLYNGKDFKLARKLNTNGGMAMSVEFSPDGQYFAVGGSDGVASLWSTDELISFKTYLKPGNIKSLSFGSNSQCLATGYDNCEIDNFLTGENILKIPGAVNCTTMHPTMSLMAVAPDDRDPKDPKVRIYKF
jgi:THO complex subunit 3